MRVEPVCGVYFLLQGGRIVYVGQSRNVHARLPGHRDKQYDDAIVLPCVSSDLDEYERLFIAAIDPELNCDTATRMRRRRLAAPPRAPPAPLPPPPPARLNVIVPLSMTVPQARRWIDDYLGTETGSQFGKAVKAGDLPIRWSGSPGRSPKGRRRLVLGEDVLAWLGSLGVETVSVVQLEQAA